MFQKIWRSTRLTLFLRRNFSSFREERDTFGPIQVPSDRLWAAQTQRSLQNFDIARDTDRMPRPIIRSFGILKKSAAIVNLRYGLDAKIGMFSPTQPTQLPVPPMRSSKANSMITSLLWSGKPVQELSPT